MRSRVVRDSVRRSQEIQQEKQRGMPASPMRMSSHRVAETQVINLFKLPCVESNAVLQNSEGEFLYLEGYSDPDGPDIGAPGG